MRTYLECVPCFVRQALDAARMATDDAAIHERVLRETLQLAAEMRFDRSPPWMGQKIHHLLREASANRDPYRQEKERSTEIALSLYPGLEQQVRSSADPFVTALRLAIAGNIIDFGCKSSVSEDDVRHAVGAAMEQPLDGAAVEDLRRSVGRAEDILYLADNAGEIVLDRLLIEELPAGRVTVAVKSGPIINDATRADAQAAGLNSAVPVIENGSDAPGTILEQCSDSFRQRFRRCDLVIAKGQGNYETLSGVDGKVFFLLKAKCPVIARDLGCEVGQMVVSRGHANKHEPA